MIKVSKETSVYNGTFYNRRKTPRVSVSIPVQVKIILLENIEVLKREKAVLLNISLSGAYVGDLSFHPGLIPSDTHQVNISANTNPLIDWCVDARVVRVQLNKKLHGGVQFVTISKENSQKLSDMMNQQLA